MERLPIEWPRRLKYQTEMEVRIGPDCTRGKPCRMPAAFRDRLLPKSAAPAAGKETES